MLQLIYPDARKKEKEEDNAVALVVPQQLNQLTFCIALKTSML